MELRDINEELNEFDRAINGVNQEKKLASHVLCVMARGLFKHINYPFGYFSAVIGLIVLNFSQFCAMQLVY